MKKLGLAGSIVFIAVIALALSACSGSSKAVKSQTSPASPAIAAPPTASMDAQKQAAVTPAAPAENGPAPSTALLKDVNFDFDRYTIRPEDAETLKGDYAWFRANPASAVRIEGNCDERGSIEYNLALGQKRADAAKNYLVGLGVPANLLRTISYGKEKPIDPGHDEQAWAKNRRAHLEPEK